MPGLSMSGLWTLKEHFGEEKKITQIPGVVVGSNPENTTVICSQEPKS